MKISYMWGVITDNYGTYRNEQTQAVEEHSYRIIGQIAASIFIATFVNELSDDNISVLVTALSILIGFAFAAMFPIALESVAGLPKPLYAEDRDDIKVIRRLAIYFRFNVAYFIPLALACVATLLIQMLNFSMPNFPKAVVDCSYYKMLPAGKYVLLAIYLNPKILVGLSMMLLQECCYTFYRMCFNALALLRIKEEYLENRPE